MAHIIANPSDNVIDCGSTDSCIRFSADAKGGPERLWFNFPIDCNNDNEISLELFHCDTLLGGGNVDGCIHPVWQDSESNWHRLATPERIAGDDGRFIFRWTLEVSNQQQIRVATCFPYQLKDLHEFISQTQLRCDNIGLSAQGRHFPRVVNKMPNCDSAIPGIFITARQHAGESPGSWILEGILETFNQAEEHDPLLWAIPFIDLDGVEESRYGKNHFPVDHNRSWYGSGLCHETRIAMAEAHRWAARCTPTVFLDLHAPGLMEEDCYFFTGSDSANAQQHELLQLIAGELGDYGSDELSRHSSYQIQHNKAVGIPNSLSANIYFEEQFDIPVLTLECSYQAFKAKPASQDDYRNVGRRIATALRQYCQQQSLTGT